MQNNTVSIRGRIGVPGDFIGHVNHKSCTLRIDHTNDESFWIEANLFELLKPEEAFCTRPSEHYSLCNDDIIVDIRGRIKGARGGHFVGYIRTANKGVLSINHTTDEGFWLEADLSHLTDKYFAYKYRPDGPEARRMVDDLFEGQWA